MTQLINSWGIQRMLDQRTGGVDALGNQCQQTKNAAIEESLDVLSKAIERLNNLHGEVSGGSCCEEAKNPEVCPAPMRPLETLLGELPADINKCASRVTETTEALRKSLM